MSDIIEEANNATTVAEIKAVTKKWKRVIKPQKEEIRKKLEQKYFGGKMILRGNANPKLHGNIKNEFIRRFKAGQPDDVATDEMWDELGFIVNGREDPIIFDTEMHNGFYAAKAQEANDRKKPKGPPNVTTESNKTEYCDLCNRDITKPEAHFLEDCKYYSPTSPGYHLTKIKKGTLGEPSKIREECDEFIDATIQGVDVMALVELSDMIGAIVAYLEKYHPSVTVNDLIKMSTVTKRAFKNGNRN